MNAKRLVSLFALSLASLNLMGQEGRLDGQVSFVTTQNIYVRFTTTEGIRPGDTLSLGESGRKCLLVQQKSSSSCVCSLLEGCDAPKGTPVYFQPNGLRKPAVQQVVVQEEPPAELQPQEPEVLVDPLQLQEIRARVSASAYSTFSDNRASRHRLMSQLMVNADHIDNSGVSLDINMNYRHILDEGASVPLPSNDLLRVYGLSVAYEASPTLTAVLGRSINPKFASVGPIDGLQVEKAFRNQYVGAILGFRPDIYDFGFNPDLLEYGAYYGLETNGKRFRSQTTFGAIEQRGKEDIDRRYAYLQHSSSLGNSLYFYGSAELDVYKKIDYTTLNEPRLTNLYVSARYRMSRDLSFTLSYDSRKRIIYYETYQSELDRFLDDDLARQGIRARVNFRPGKTVYTGLSYSKRFRSDQQNKSDNYNGFVTLSETPFIGGRTSLTLNRNESNYLISNIGSLRHSRTFMRNRLQTDLYYRLVHSDYVNFGNPMLQHYAGTDITYYLTKSLFFSLTGEFATYEGQNNYRFYARAVQRFHSKRKR